MSAKSTLAIALTAIAAGAALGVLLAPASGKETRKKLVRKGNDLKDRLSDMLAQGQDLMDDLRDEADHLADKARATAKETRDRVKDKVQEAANRAAATN
ncbi:MAG: YtxH domain-containing protein [Flavobacteriales bacterium]|nr:YtxH domain-containing protein [Flavobacteriales bacterium]